jgi:spore maturation protein SpmA
MNIVFFGMVLVAFLTGAVRQLAWTGAGGGASPLETLSKAVVQSAGDSVTLAIGLIGVMTLFLGLVKVAEAGGLLRVIARLIRPLMVRLFPDVPSEHPAMGAMVLNLSANAMGLGNAATPFGIRAMQELDKLNPRPGVTTNAMALFLAINTSSVTLLPTGVIALRAAAGSADPAGIVPTTLFATFCSTAVAVLAAKLYSRFSKEETIAQVAKRQADPRAVHEQQGPSDDIQARPYPAWLSLLALLALASLIPFTIFFGRRLSPWIIPGLMVAFLAFGAARRVRVYEVFVEGAKEGFQVAVRIIPYLVAILVAVAMLRASGALDALTGWLGMVTGRVGLPGEALPMALLRPLSGSGAYGILASIINDPAIGPDSYVGYLVSTLQGSTETTFYVIAVYFGAVQIKCMRHALAAALTADLAGIAGAVVACKWILG